MLLVVGMMMVVRVSSNERAAQSADARDGQDNNPHRR